MELEPLNEDACKHRGNVTTDQRTKLNDERGIWGNRVEFLLAIIGFSVGMGNIWRFPMLCASNGGGAFLIPFCFFMFICAGPLYYIEVCLGQFSGQSAGSAFEFCPLFKGIGLLMVLISFDVLWYYVSIMGWIQYYFIQSFHSQLPWSTCGNWWNTENCRESAFIANVNYGVNNATTANATSLSSYNMTNNITSVSRISVLTSPANEFWLYNVLRKSDGLEDMGTIQWHLLISNFIALLIAVISLIKGVKSLGKVVYFTATAPYILLTVLLIRCLTLDGAIDGITWYITPDFEMLASPKVWLQAAIQVFFSLGPAYGGALTMASHNKFHQKTIVETVICILVDAFTGFYAGLVVFSCMGYMAKETGEAVDVVARTSGLGLVFVAYPEVVSRLPMPQLWAALFFFTLITVAFDTIFSYMETVAGSLLDMFPRQLLPYKTVVLIGVALLVFILGIPFSMNGGIYLFRLADWYVTAYALMFGASLEAIMVCWIYGADRFAEDIALMTGRKVSKLLRICWCFFMPALLLLMCVVTIVSNSEPSFSDSYVYQPYAITVGMLIAMVPFVPVVFLLVKGVLNTEGTLAQRIKYLMKPSSLWQPADEQAREMYSSKPYIYEDTLSKRIRANLLGSKNTPWI